MQLPEALQPWRQWLEWFAPEQWPLFADLLGRISPLLGPLRGQHQGGVPEPDGLGDLQRRGPYERLLSSEWLLADEVPDEFLRRAAVGEHLFLAPQQRARQANRLIVVLLDAGPLQLGAARLVHLALLILLARRAKEAGAEVRWGILQGAPVLHDFAGPGHLKQLLHARSWELVNSERWQAWREWLAEQQEMGECWVVGQRLLAADSPFATHRVHVHRSLDSRNLWFELQGSASRRVALPIPDERLALQLLKGQFDGEVVSVKATINSAVPRVVITLPPVIAGAGTHVALRMLDEPGMVVIKLPGAQQKKALEVRRKLWSGGLTLLACTFLNREIGGVLSDQRHLVFWGMQGFNPVVKPDREQLQLPPGTAHFLPAAWLRAGSAARLYLLDAKGHLGYWAAHGKSAAKPVNPSVTAKKVDHSGSAYASKDAPTPYAHSMGPGGAHWVGERGQEPGKLHRLTDHVLGLAQVDHHVMAYVSEDGGRLFAQSIGPSGRLSTPHLLGPPGAVSRVLFVGAPAWRKVFGGCALLTLVESCERWQVTAPAPFANSIQTQQIELARGWKGIGLLRLGNDALCSMVLLGADQQSVALYTQGQQQILFTTSNAIVQFSFCPMSCLVAVLTIARELLVYSVRQQTMRLQVLCNQAPDTATKEGANA